MKLLKISVLLLTSALFAQGTWRVSEPGFRPLAVASSAAGLWVSGANEFIAVSTDDGQHWTNKHSLSGGGSLWGIAFPSNKFGFATGSGGTLLTTEDGGDSWRSHPKAPATILQSSFSDARHGIVRTRTSLLITKDGGETWMTAVTGEASEILKQFPFTHQLIAIDADHMLMVLRAYAEVYHEERVLATTDGGATWKPTHLDIEHTDIHAAVGDANGYWAYVGQMVDLQHQGGHPMFRGFRSTDGFTWKASPPIPACQWKGCTSCTVQGCFAGNGLIVRITGDATTYDSFPSNPELTAKWAATDNVICFVGSKLQCAPLHRETRDISHDVKDNAPSPIVPAALSAPPGGLPNCLICPVESIFIDPDSKGMKKAALKLLIHVGTDGLVQEVEISGAPSAAIEEQIRKRIQGWLFDPYIKDGVAVKLDLRAGLNIVVMGSK